LGISFDYGQAAANQERKAAYRIAEHYAITLLHTNISEAVYFADNALMEYADIPMPIGHAQAPDATNVPGRNLVFIALAAAYGMTVQAHQIAFGAIIGGRAGYADCRQGFIEAVDEALDHVSRDTIGLRLHAPFQEWTKADVISLGQQLNVPLHLTWTCYTGNSEPCGVCGACDQRQQGFDAA